MKQLLFILLASSWLNGHSQSQEAQQLLLDWEKLTQFRKILQDMYEGYQILHKGYTTIRDISSGNFNLHKGFLDGLLEVSPAVKKYKRITDIVNYQLLTVKQCKAALASFKQKQIFSAQEIDYLGKVYSNLLNESLKNLEELGMVLTAGKLRMSDEERLGAIDRIYQSVVDQFSFLSDFNSQAGLLAAQRSSEQWDVKRMQQLSGVAK